MKTKKVIVLGAICMTSIMFGLEISSVPVILPSLQNIMSSSFSQIEWIMNAYTIACTMVLMATGSLADRFGRKRLYLISIALFGLTSFACGMAGNVSLLIAARFVQGIGGGAMLICQIAVLSQQFREGKERALAFSMWGIVFGAGLGFGPIIGGAIMAMLSWKWIFLIHVPLSAMALLLVAAGATESKDPNAQKLDIPGIILLSMTVCGLTFFITQGPEIGFVSLADIAIFILTVICFLLFIRAEKVSSYPMFDFSVFRIYTFSGALLGSMGMNFSFWPFIVYFPIYFQHALGYDVVTTGLSLLGYTIPTLIIPPLAERLSLKYRPGIIIPLGMFTIGSGFFLMRLGIGQEHASWLTVLPGALVAGAGLGLTNTPVTNTTTSSIPESRAGMASGIDMSARLITLAINIALMGFILIAGIYTFLSNAHYGNSANRHILSAKIASGNIPLQPFYRQALVHGFEWAMLYAAIGVWVLAAISFKIFKNADR
ncbi:MFS transporter [Mucilaginibacter sp. CAU 1740]|uniref:MFS transporter n=1 Tax=Mucilaginibacter sp. CAU 1740 TaxID=3140365 RepID=UPI00325BAAF1